MKIVELRATNIKKLKAVSIKPTGNMVEITGRNAQGKTSVLDCIWWALAGTSKIQSAPIRNGQKKARIELDLGKVKVSRTMTRTEDGDFTSSIVVENEDGARFPSPQKLLDSFLGALTFDPLEFARREPKAQFEALKQFVPDVDFQAIASERKANFDRRTEIKRKAKEARASAESFQIPETVPAEAIDESALISKLDEAGTFNTTLERRKARREETTANVARARDIAKDERSQAQAFRDQAQEFLRRAEERDAEAARFDADAGQMQKQLDEAEPLPEPIDTTTIRAEIEKARATNKLVDQRYAREKWAAIADSYEKTTDDLTTAIEDLDRFKREKIAAAQMPIDGLSFGDDEILLNGVPFEQASDAEQLRASVAIAMAMNPKLRVIRVRDGSLLDDDALRLLAQMADEKDCQVWIERVDSSGKVGFVLEDGEVRAAPVSEAAE